MKKLLFILGLSLALGQVNAQTINSLGAGAAVQSTDILPVYQGANPATGITAAQLKTFTGGGTVNSIATSCGVSGGTITTTGTIQGITTVNPQTGVNYPIVSGDCGKLVNLSNASNQIPTIPSGATLGSGWFTEVCNQGAGTQTITPASGTIGGASTYVLATGTAAAPKCVGLVSDGTNLQLDLTGIGGSASSGANPSATASDTAVNGAASTFMRSDGAPAVQKGTNAQFGLAEGDGTSISMTAGVVQRSALTGDVTASAGSSATTLAAGNAGNLNSGTLLAARMPALTGDVTSSAGSIATTQAYKDVGPGYQASRVYLPAGSGNGGSGTAQIIQTVYCVYGYLRQTATLSGLSVDQTTAGSTNWNLGVYSNAASGFGPGTLIDKTGNIANTGANGYKTASFAGGNHQLTASTPYWFCEMTGDASSVIVTQNPTGSFPATYIGAPSGSEVSLFAVAAQVNGISCSAACNGGTPTTLVLPTDLTATTWTQLTTGRAPLIGIVLASVP